MKTINLFAVVFMFVASCFGLSAQTETKYERGATYLENTMPPSPEPASIVKYADVPFTHSTGMAEYDVPFYTLKGRELSIPIGLHYASGGIKLDEIAGVAGLGWTLNAGGCITRTVMDMPDEYVPLVGPFRHEVPSGQLLSDLEGMVNTDSTLSFLRDLIWNRIDSALDRYSYSVCGMSGSFVIKDDGTVFQLSGDGVVITYTRADDGSVDEFVLTGPDGNVYTLSLKEMASRDGRGIESVGPMNGSLDQWTAPTTWYLTSIRSRSGLETAVFTYSGSATWDRSVRSRSETLTMLCGGGYDTPARDITLKSVESTYETHVLTGITLAGITVSFSYSQGTGDAIRTEDSPTLHNYPFRLTGMSVSADGNSECLKRIDVSTGRSFFDGRIVLNGLSIYTAGRLDDKWTFTYKTIEKTVSAGSQDWYGYYNGENEFSEDGNNILCPYEANLFGQGSFSLTNGFPDAEHASYMSLISVDNDGAVTNFTYEGNVFSTSPRSLSMGVRVKNIILSGNSLKPVKVRYFTYDHPFSSGPQKPSEAMYCTVSMNYASPGESSSCNWQFTLHETPVTLGSSIRDSRMFYGKVTEDVSDLLFLLPDGSIPNFKTVRTVYEYSMSGVSQYVENCVGRFPEFCSEFYNGYYAHPLCRELLGIREGYSNSGPSVPPVLTRRTDYAYRDGSYESVSSTEYVYDGLVRTSVLVDYHAVQAYRHWFEGYMEHKHIYHFPIYATGNYGRHPVKEIRVGYHPSGNDTIVVNTSYVERLSMEAPVRVSAVSMTEGKALRKINYKYADTWPNGDTWTTQLEDQHCLSTPIWKGITYEDRSVLHLPDTLIPVRPSSLDIDPIPFPTLPDLSETYADIEEITRYGWFIIGGERCLLPSSHVEYHLGTESWREDVLSRDTNGNITSIKEKGKPEAVILWSYTGSLPVAYIQNASFAQVQTAMGGSAVISSLASAQSPSQTHLTKLAQLRSVLPQAHITTYSHIPGIGVESIIDPAGIKTSFEYDGGRLVCIRDNDDNKVEEYEYDLLCDANGRRHMHRRTFRSTDEQTFSEDIHWWDAFGRKTQDIAVDAAGNGSDLVTAYESDFMFHDDVKTWLPYPVQDTGGEFQSDADNSSASYHGNPLAYALRSYEMSALNRVTSEALPGYAGVHESSEETDVAGGIINYRWIDDKIFSLLPYASDEVVAETFTDADGRIKSIYKDHSGRTLASRNGTDAPTYYIYDIYDRLRAVAGSGISITDTLNMWRYDYDSLGRVSSKGIPGSVREFYSYDDEDRIVSVLRDGVLKEMEYDAMNRVTKVYQTKDGGQRVLMEQHTYDTYPSGVTGANPKGLRTASHLAEVGPDGGVTGFADVRFVYDDRKRPVQTQIRYRDGSILSEQTEYGFAGEVISSLYTYSSGGNVIGKLQQNYTYDNRGRICSETATLYKSVGQNVSALKRYVYDDLGRVSGTVTEVPGGIRLVTDMEHTLQGWVSSQETSIDGEILFAQNLGYDSGNILSGTEPSYTGLITRKDDTWFQNSQQMSILTNGYTYDYAGRLASEVSDDLSTTEYGYDARGNLLSVLKTGFSTSSIYSGDVLTSVTSAINGAAQTVSFVHDALGRMTYDGTTGQAMTYNTLDLIGKVSKGGTVLANYFYLADGTKIGALDGSGEGLMYRGPFVYRKTSGSSSLTLESAAFGGGRLTPGGAMLYVTDYLGSVRAVVNGATGAIYKASDFSAFGAESDAASVQKISAPLGTTFRDAYTGKEDQHPDFGTGYTDFGARQYSSALRRWMTPDPLSEKYYGISPYAFCANNPVNIVDADGESWGKVVKVANKIRKAKKAGDKVRLKGILKSEVLDIADNASTLADSDASLFEKSVAVIDLATGFGDQVKWFAKTCGISNAVIDGVQVIDGIKFKSFTRNNFRENLGRLTGGIPDGMQAHHTLPYAFEDKFSDIGINIHNPKYGVWLDSKLHNKLSHKYNEAWAIFFDANSTYTEEQVVEYATKLMNDIYGQ